MISVFENMLLSVVILAAGNSTRMNSDVPKIFHELAGAPLIAHVFNAVSALDPFETVFVINKNTTDHVFFKDKAIAVQESQNGTAHAVQSSLHILDLKDLTVECQETNRKMLKKVLILCGDIPLITTSTLKEFIKSSFDFNLSILAFDLKEDPLPYGRIVLDSNQIPKEIIEFNENKELAISMPLANAGIYCMDIEILTKCLSLIDNKNTKLEYYLTDIVKISYNNGFKNSIFIGQQQECLGINTRKELKDMENFFQNDLKEKAGISATLINKDSIHLSFDTKIGRDVVIEPHVYVGKNVTIGDHVRIKAFCYLENCEIKSGSIIGPFAHIREFSLIENNVCIGNYVEIKKSTIGTGTNTKHLSYIGDSTIGSNVNIGAGVITCNYDGKEKHQTIIENNAFIGSNSVIIAPRRIKNNSYIAAGSVVDRDVPEGSLAISRSKCEIKEGWVKNRFKQPKL